MNITTLSVYEKYEYIVQFLFSVVDEFQTSNLRASTGWHANHWSTVGYSVWDSPGLVSTPEMFAKQQSSWYMFVFQNSLPVLCLQILPIMKWQNQSCFTHSSQNRASHQCSYKGSMGFPLESYSFASKAFISLSLTLWPSAAKWF